MPASAVPDQDRVCASCHLDTDFLQMLGHRLGVDRGHDDRGAHPASGTDRAEQMRGIMAVVAHHQRTGALLRPDIGMTALLSHAGFVLKPYLDRLAGQNSAAQKGLLHQARKVFLKASWAASSFFG